MCRQSPICGRSLSRFRRPRGGIRLGFLIPALFALLFVACGDNGETGTPRDSAPPPAAGEAPAAAATAPAESEAAPPATPPAAQAPAAEAPAQAAEEPGTPAAAVALSWTPFPAAEIAPEPRSNAVLAFDPQRQMLYLHGGRSDGKALADLWAYDIVGGAWTRLEPPGEAPAARFGHNAIFDQARGRFLVFGGQGSPSLFFGDVWAYDSATRVWSRLADNGAGPTDRYGSCIGYDAPADRFLISHGFTNNGRFDDTWAFSLIDNRWSDISPDSPRPGERCLHTCVYDTAANAFVLFGGQNNSVSQLGDTWILQEGAWNALSSDASTGDAPSARRFPVSAAFDGRMWLFGGVGADGRTDDLWSFDVQNRRWTAQAIAPGPAVRHSHAAALDDSTGQLFIFGGSGDDGELNDLWVLRRS